MADKITIEQVNELQAILLRSDVSLDAKVQHLAAAKSGIKQHNVPDNVVAPLFDALRSASLSQHAVLVNAGFTSLNHLLTRLSRQEPRFLAKEAGRTLPVIVDKLGDQKEKYRLLAQQALVTMYGAAPMDVERSIRNTAMAGKNPRTKESSMQWLLQMHQEQGLPFRGYVPALMELLEDADGMVRDAARATVIELFRNAPNAAKTDLKKQLKNFKVRPAIEQAIVKELIPTAGTTTTVPTGSGASSGLDRDAGLRPESVRSLRPAASTSSLSAAAAASAASAAERPVTPVPTDAAFAADPVDPSYINTQRELEDVLKDMHIWFEGRETEQNWLKREESITKLRRLVAGNAADFPDAFLNGVRGMLDGIIKGIVSLRTSLCKEACSLIQDLAHVFGPGIDPLVELLLQTLIKLSAGTKKISSQLANASVDAIVAKATYNSRMMQHIWAACQDKNVQPRTYACGWVRTVLTRESRHKERFEHSGGLDVLEKCVKKGLLDPNPGVRERMRASYWAYYGFWPARADAMMDSLDAQAQKLLQNDANNPNSPRKEKDTAGSRGKPRVGSSAAVRPGLGLSKSTMGGGPPSAKPSLRETMLAKRKEAMAARNLPTRPGSAMAHFSPVRTTSSATAPATSSTTTSATVTSSTAGGASRAHRAEGGGGGNAVGGLSVAPVRPTRRRPELHARPATAGPYSVRSHDQTSMEQSSPPERERVRPKATVTPKSLAASPKRTAGPVRPRPAGGGHQASASESSVLSPTRQAATAGPLRTTQQRQPQPQPQQPQAQQHQHQHQHQQPRQAQQMPAYDSPLSSPIQRRPVAAALLSSPSHTAPMLRGGENLAYHDIMADDEDMHLQQQNQPLSAPLKVYEDPFTEEDLAAPARQTGPVFTTTALEDKPVNEDAANLARLAEENAAAAAAAAAAAEAGGMGGMGGMGGDGAGGPRSVALGSMPPMAVSASPEKYRQNVRLLDSGIARVKAKTLDVHGFRKLQGIIRDAGSIGGGSNMTMTIKGSAVANENDSGAKPPQLFTDERFNALLLGLFAYLEVPPPAPSTTAHGGSTVATPDREKAQDVKAQILATIKLLLRKGRDSFAPHVSRGLEALLGARAAYDARTHIVAGLELLADELVALGDVSEIVQVLGTRLADKGTSPQSLSMGLHVLKVLVDGLASSTLPVSSVPSLPSASSSQLSVASPLGPPSDALALPTDSELGLLLTGLAQQCLDSNDSGVRMDAVQMCVAVHARVGDVRFWGALPDIKDDPKSLITYYIVKRQREQGR